MLFFSGEKSILTTFAINVLERPLTEPIRASNLDHHRHSTLECPMRSSAFGVIALIAGGACASQTAATPAVAGVTATQQSASPANRNRDLITRDELTKPSVVNMTVLDAVRSLRPHFLTVRGTNTVPAKTATGQQVVDMESGKVHASIDGNKIVPIEELSSLRAGSVAEVQYLSPAAAMQKFGGASRQGPVILVKTM
jgi:hypothetical protein